MSAIGIRRRYWMGGRQLNERTLAVLEGGRVMDWDTVALLDGRPLDERTLAVLSAGLKIRWRCWMGGRKLNEHTLVMLDTLNIIIDDHL